MTARLAQIRELLAACTPAERRAIYSELQHAIEPHPFAMRLNAPAEAILAALDRAADISIRGVRGLLAEAVFVTEVAAAFKGWTDATPPGNHLYDQALRDEVDTVRVQVKMQRKEKGTPVIKHGAAIVEVQKTRTGTKGEVQTRPYRFTDFDMLAVCLEPSLGRWNIFHYIPAKWLYPRPKDGVLIKIMQPVPLQSDAVWTNDFDEAVRRLRSDKSRP